MKSMTWTAFLLLAGASFLAFLGPAPANGLRCYVCGREARDQNSAEFLSSLNGRQLSQQERQWTAEYMLADRAAWEKPCKEDWRDDTLMECLVQNPKFDTPTCNKFWTNDGKIARNCGGSSFQEPPFCDLKQRKHCACRTDACNKGGAGQQGESPPQPGPVGNGPSLNGSGTRFGIRVRNGAGPLAPKFGLLVMMGLALLLVTLANL